MKKSNIFAYVELSKLVENLHQADRSLKENFIVQVSYFQILDPKYFSDALSPEWIQLRQRLGYSQELAQQGQNDLKNSMRASIQNLTEAQCREVLVRLTDLLDRLSREFEK